MPEALRRLLRRIDGRPYPAYRDLGGRWHLGDGVELSVDRVQGDPFAAPSRVRIKVAVGVPVEIATDPDRCLAAEDWFLRRFGESPAGVCGGSGRSGALEVYRPGPEIVERSAVRVHPDGDVEVRFAVGLPARRRRILGPEAEALLLRDVPAAAARLVCTPALNQHIASVVRQRALRRALGPAGLVAFIEDGAVLPRASGVDSRPLPGAVAWSTPPGLAVDLPVPGGVARGLGVRRGVTLITGGGFHGKSTVLTALERGHLDHVPGDGREGVVSTPRSAKVRAEEGRCVRGVDISSLLGPLPGGADTSCFHTRDASGSTSQAAALVEAVESGAELILIDEDTSATNLLARDERMRALLGRGGDPITPLVERIRQMVEAWDLSFVMVVGGLGDYLAVADTVLGMIAWRAADLTSAAHELAGPPPSAPGPVSPVVGRVLGPEGLEVDRVRARDRRAVALGEGELDLSAVAGVLDKRHAATLGHTLIWLAANGLLDGRRALPSVLDALEAIFDDEGIEVVSPFSAPPGDLVRPRRHEVAAALSRLRPV